MRAVLLCRDDAQTISTDHELPCALHIPSFNGTTSGPVNTILHHTYYSTFSLLLWILYVILNEEMKIGLFIPAMGKNQ